MKTLLSISLITLNAMYLAGAADFDVRNEGEFKKCISADARVEKVAGDFKFTEGPVWVPQDGGYLIFSDIPANELKRWDAKSGITIFRRPSNHANGNTIDNEGRLITCEHSGRRLSIWEKDGTINPLVEKSDGKRFNSPNDVAVTSDGTLWFTDPDYGLGGNSREQKGNFVYRFNPKFGSASPMVTDFDKPNGICFSPDERKVYVADSGKPHHIRVFDVTPNEPVRNGKVLCTIEQGVPDGIRCDDAGRIWSSAGDGVHIFASDGTLIGKILTPEPAANLAFGGTDGRTLFITARTSVYSVGTLVKGTR
jgi:gluconolactonase